MDTRKASAPWYIAATHYLTAGFAIPFIGGLLLGIVFGILGISLGDGPLSGLYLAPFSLLMVYFGVIYSARYLRRKYIIQDAMHIVNLSTIYLIVIRVLFTGFGAAILLSPMAAGTPQAQALPMLLGIGALQALLEVAVFYYTSKQQLVDMAAFTIDAPQTQTPPQLPPQQ
jgi:hypothetical protein